MDNYYYFFTLFFWAVYLAVIAIPFWAVWEGARRIAALVFKKEKNFLKISFAVFFPLLVVFGLLLLFVVPGAGDGIKRNAKRMADMKQLAAVQEKYFSDHQKYFSSRDFPENIGQYLSPVPKDPGGGEAVACGQPGAAFIYCALDNTASGDDRKFCYFTKLENNSKQPYYVASGEGNIRRSTPPATLNECMQEN